MSQITADYDQNPPFQTEIRRVYGSPQGVLDARIGTLVSDSKTGDLWIKKSIIGTLTGWVNVTAV